MASASDTQQTPEQEQALAEEELRPTDPTEEDLEALEELRLRFDTMDSEPLSRLRGDIRVPRTTDQLHTYFKADAGRSFLLSPLTAYLLNH